MSPLFLPSKRLVRALRTFFGLVCAIALAGCSSGSGDDGGGAPPAGATCDQVCRILNGASVAGQTTYWQIPNLNCNVVNCHTKLALFADGTGKIMQGGMNMCTIPIGSPPGTTSVPLTTTFNWVQTGPATVLFTGAVFHCSFNPLVDRGSLTSMTAINGGISTATIQATVAGGFITGPSSGSFSGNLVIGTI